MLESYQNARPDKLHPSYSLQGIRLPRRFRSLRALLISSWFFPDWLKYEILLSFGKTIFSLDWNNKGLERSLELALYSSTEREMLSFVRKNINTRVLFGTILKEDLKNALNEMELIPEKTSSPKRKVRRKGYQDKGTWRPPHRWMETSDWTFNEIWTKREKQKLIFQFLFNAYRYTLSRGG
jgi:hypothetical protein